MKLAINGGTKVREKSFPKQNTLGVEEQDAVIEFIKSGKLLSNFRGNWQPEFWGGENIQTFEKEWTEIYGGRHAITTNSCTSALQISCQAIGLKPGDEVIVTPWSMTCSATAPMICGATPVFADIEKDYFCLDPESIKEKITRKTRAIIVVDLFGQPFSEEINKIAEENNLYIIEDAAQAPGAERWNKNDQPELTGTLGDLGCFSFTQGKHITSGEGGLILTNSSFLSQACALLRNHAESVLNAIVDKGEPNDDFLKEAFCKFVGGNLRMTEIQAVILRKQLQKLFPYIMARDQKVKMINEVLSNIPCITKTETRPGCTHSYYVQGFYFDSTLCNGIHRDVFISAINAELAGEEGRPDRPMIGCGYIKPLYKMPLFQALGYKDCLPVVENLWENDFFLSMYHNLPLNHDDIADIGRAFAKVLENKEELLKSNLL